MVAKAKLATLLKRKETSFAFHLKLEKMWVSELEVKIVEKNCDKSLENFFIGIQNLLLPYSIVPSISRLKKYYRI